MPNSIKHSLPHCGIISHARCVWQNFVLLGILVFGITATLSAQYDDEWGDLQPDLINRRILILRHYDRKGYSVLPDILRSPKDCCENETWVIVDTVTIPAGETMTVPSPTFFDYDQQGDSTVFKWERKLDIQDSLQTKVQIAYCFGAGCTPSDSVYASGAEPTPAAIENKWGTEDLGGGIIVNIAKAAPAASG